MKIKRYYYIEYMYEGKRIRRTFTELEVFKLFLFKVLCNPDEMELIKVDVNKEVEYED